MCLACQANRGRVLSLLPLVHPQSARIVHGDDKLAHRACARVCCHRVARKEFQLHAIQAPSSWQVVQRRRWGPSYSPRASCSWPAIDARMAHTIQHHFEVLLSCKRHWSPSPRHQHAHSTLTNTHRASLPQAMDVRPVSRQKDALLLVCCVGAVPSILLLHNCTCVFVTQTLKS